MQVPHNFNLKKTIMQIYSVNGDFYTSYDLAVINAIGTHFKVKKHEVDETKDIDIERTNIDSELYFIDESGKEYIIEFEAKYSRENDVQFFGDYIDIDIEEIFLDGVNMFTLNISNDLKNQIEREVENLADKVADEMMSGL